MNFSFATIPAISILVYWLLELVKIFTSNNEKIKRCLPLMATGIGLVLGVIIYYFLPSVQLADNVLFAMVTGGVSGLAATGSNQIFKQLAKFSTPNEQNPAQTPSLNPMPPLPQKPLPPLTKQPIPPNPPQKPTMPPLPKPQQPLKPARPEPKKTTPNQNQTPPKMPGAPVSNLPFEKQKNTTTQQNVKPK